MNKFSVTYEIVTEESAEDGDSAESGFVGEGLSLRDALDLAASTESCHCGRSAVEASDSRPGMAQWVTFYNSQDWQSGQFENRSLHIPDGVTAASRARIVRLALNS